jgi:hypothetical protein
LDHLLPIDQRATANGDATAARHVEIKKITRLRPCGGSAG